jgi:hypothetical protein
LINQNTQGNIFFLDGVGPINYSKIQDAIDNASIGYTVFVYNGTYSQNLVIDYSNLSLIQINIWH